MTTYLKVRMPGKTVLLRDPTEGSGLLLGIEVNKQGDEIAGEGFDQRLRIFATEAITSTTEMTMNLKYAELEEKKR